MPGPRRVTVLARLALALVLALSCALGSIVRGDDKELELPAPREQPAQDKDEPENPALLPPDYAAGLPPALPVTFLDVLRLASLANLDIAQANLTVERARAGVLRAKGFYLPNLTLGSTYTSHDGTIQRTEGQVVEVNRDSLFAGLGTAFSLNIADALFTLPEARRRLDAAFSGQVATTNETLGRVSDAYFAVLRARRRLAAYDETLDFLTSEQESELRGKSRGLLPLIKAFVKSGTALPSDQYRVEADVARRSSERVRFLQEVRTTSAELARLLHVNALVFLLPCEDYRWPIDVPGRDWCQQPVDCLVMQALRHRPELAENASLLQAAYLRYQQSKYRPMVPSLVVSYSYGGFGGGPRVVARRGTTNILGHSGVIADFDTRSDIDVGLVWRLQGLGVGNTAQTWDDRVRLEQRHVRQLFLQDQVISQVVQAHEQVQRAQERVAITRSSLFDEMGKPTGAVYRSLRLNFVRIRGGQGLPLEVLDSTRRLLDVLDNYANAISDFDQARFRLLVALGLPPSALVDPALLPPPPCPPVPPRGVNFPASPSVDKGTDREKNEDRPQDKSNRGDKTSADGFMRIPGAPALLPPPRIVGPGLLPLPPLAESRTFSAGRAAPRPAPTAPPRRPGLPDDGL